MKRFFLLLAALCPLLLLGQSFTRTAAFRGAAVQRASAATECSYTITNAASIAVARSIASDAGSYFVGQADFTVAETTLLDKVTFALSRAAGDIAGFTYTVDVRIYNHSTGLMTDFLGSSEGVAGNNDWSTNYVEFTFTTPVTLTNGAYYAIAIGHAGSSGTTYARMFTTAAGQITGNWGRWNADGTFGSGDTGDSKIALCTRTP